MKVPRWSRFKYVMLVGGTGAVEALLGMLGFVCGLWMGLHDYAPTPAAARVLYWAPGDMLRNTVLVVGGLIQFGGVGVRWPAARAWVATALLMVCVWLLVVYWLTAPSSAMIPVLTVAALFEFWVAARVHTDHDVNGHNRRGVPSGHESG